MAESVPFASLALGELFTTVKNGGLFMRTEDAFGFNAVVLVSSICQSALEAGRLTVFLPGQLVEVVSVSS